LLIEILINNLKEEKKKYNENKKPKSKKVKTITKRIIQRAKKKNKNTIILYQNFNLQ
jgi:hypothetical protein